MGKNKVVHSIAQTMYLRSDQLSQLSIVLT